MRTCRSFEGKCMCVHAMRRSSPVFCIAFNLQAQRRLIKLMSCYRVRSTSSALHVFVCCDHVMRHYIRHFDRNAEKVSTAMTPKDQACVHPIKALRQKSKAKSSLLAALQCKLPSLHICKHGMCLGTIGIAADVTTEGQCLTPACQSHGQHRVRGRRL